MGMRMTSIEYILEVIQIVITGIKKDRAILDMCKILMSETEQGKPKYSLELIDISWALKDVK